MQSKAFQQFGDDDDDDNASGGYGSRASYVESRYSPQRSPPAESRYSPQRSRPAESRYSPRRDSPSRNNVVATGRGSSGRGASAVDMARALARDGHKANEQGDTHKAARLFDDAFEIAPKDDFDVSVAKEVDGFLLSAANMFLKVQRLDDAISRYSKLLTRPHLEPEMRLKCEEKLRDHRIVGAGVKASFQPTLMDEESEAQATLRHEAEAMETAARERQQLLEQQARQRQEAAEREAHERQIVELLEEEEHQTILQIEAEERARLGMAEAGSDVDVPSANEEREALRPSTKAPSGGGGGSGSGATAAIASAAGGGLPFAWPFVWPFAWPSAGLSGGGGGGGGSGGSGGGGGGSGGAGRSDLFVVARRFGGLGLTAFGSSSEQVACLKAQGWRAAVIDDAAFGSLVALCEDLPGLSCSQVRCWPHRCHR